MSTVLLHVISIPCPSFLFHAIPMPCHYYAVWNLRHVIPIPIYSCAMLFLSLVIPMLPSPRYRWEGLKSKSKLVFNNSSPEGRRVDLVDWDIRPDWRLGAGGGRSSGVGWSSASHAPVGKRSLAVPQTPTAATNRRFWKIESSLALKSGPSLQ